jgi:hypothetical protein
MLTRVRPRRLGFALLSLLLLLGLGAWFTRPKGMGLIDGVVVASHLEWGHEIVKIPHQNRLAASDENAFKRYMAEHHWRLVEEQRHTLEFERRFGDIYASRAYWSVPFWLGHPSYVPNPMGTYCFSWLPDHSSKWERCPSAATVLPWAS